MAATRPHEGLDWRTPGYYEAALERWSAFIDIDPAVEQPTAAAEQLQAIEDIFAEVLSTLASPPQSWRRVIYSRWMISNILRQHSGNAYTPAPQVGRVQALGTNRKETTTKKIQMTRLASQRRRF